MRKKWKIGAWLFSYYENLWPGFEKVAKENKARQKW